MGKSRKLPNGSFVRGSLPKSCVMCQQGAKMVLLVTGKCAHSCFYCPLSLKKKGRAVTYADELLVKSDEDVIHEAKSIGAKGTGITGGDPLLAMRETLHYIRLLKSEFGRGHNIHLYTATPETSKIAQLAEARLDEIRFHPPPEAWDGFYDTEYPGAIRAALDNGMRAGLEIPSIPGMEDEMEALARSAWHAGAEFLNMNELEFSESNWQALLARGFKVKDDVSSAVLGSEKAASAVARKVAGDMIVHFCSSRFKDATQLRNRLMRRANNTATGLEVITDEAMFLKGIIEVNDPERHVVELRRKHDIPARLIRYDSVGKRIEIAAWILEEIIKDIPGKGSLVWEYPTADRLEVERQPLD